MAKGIEQSSIGISPRQKTFAGNRGRTFPRYKRSFQFGGNLLGSPKILKFSRPKWGVLTRNAKKKVSSSPTGIELDVIVSSLYGKQWRAKQSFKGLYGLKWEKQWHRFVRMSCSLPEGYGLGSLLESRLDTVLWRSRLVPSIFMARQLIAHGQVFVEGRKVDSSSTLIKVGQRIQVKFTEKIKIRLKREMLLTYFWLSPFDSFVEGSYLIEGKRVAIPPHLEVSFSTLSVIFSHMPKELEFNYIVSIELNRVLEFYKDVSLGKKFQLNF